MSFEESGCENEIIEQVIKNVTQDSVKITKNTKGYNWEVSVHGDDVVEALEKAIVIDQRLRDRFGVSE